jgi:hypothetical protein
MTSTHGVLISTGERKYHRALGARPDDLSRALARCEVTPNSRRYVS